MDPSDSIILRDPEDAERMRKIYFNACQEFDANQLGRFLEVLEGNSPLGAKLILKGNQATSKRHEIEDADFHAIFTTLQSNYSFVRSIDISYNSLSADVCVSIGKALVKNKSVKILVLSMCDIDVDGCFAISKGLEYNICLEKLLLNGNSFGPEGCFALAAVLQVNDSLKTLDIGSTDQTSQSLIPISTVLTMNASIQELDVSRTIPYSDPITLTDHFSKMLTINLTLSKLKLSKCEITDEGASTLAFYLRYNTTLNLIDLSSNKIAPDGAKAFADLLSKNNTLETLILSSNCIQDIGMIAISEVLACQNVGLKKLWVTNNFITDSGLCPLAASLNTNKTLSHLYIWGNVIGEKACNAFLLLCSGEDPRLKPQNIDVQPYNVDGINYLAETGQYPWSH